MTRPAPRASRRAAPRVVVSAFGPWGTLPSNPTLVVLERLAADPGGVAAVIPLPLPVDTRVVEEAVAAALALHRPALWIGLGLALGSPVVAVERVAVNLLDFIEPDIAGARPAGCPIVPDGPAAYLATLPVRAMVGAMRAAGIPAAASDTAGAFLCNQLMYTVLHRIAATGAPTRAGFLHLPADPALVAGLEGPSGRHPSMGLELTTEAVRVALRTCLA